MKKLLFFFVLLAFITNNIFSQIRIKEISSNLPTHLPKYSKTETRNIIPFNDNWTLTPENSESSGTSVSIPSQYSSNETMVYQKLLELTSESISKNNFIIHFLGIAYSADVYLNDVVIYKKPGGNVPFAVMLPSDLLNDSEPNKITVKVVNELDSKSTIPLYQRFLFPQYLGGIVRDVFLEVIPKENIEIIRFGTNIDNNFKSAELNFDLLINGKSDNSNYSVKLSLIDKDGNIKSKKLFNLSDFSNNELELKLNVKKPILWSPQNPYNYTVEIKLMKRDSLIDVSKKNILFAKFDSRPEGIFFNNKPFTLNGVTYIHSNEKNGTLITYSELKKDLEMIKAVGFNSVRFAKAEPHPYALDICAEIGLLAFVELPLNSIPERFIDDENFSNRLLGYAENFSKVYFNYPAVFAMGVGGGYLSNSKSEIELVSKLGNIVHTKLRKLSFASFSGIPSKEIKDIDLYGFELFSNVSDLEEHLLLTSINKNKIFISEATYPTYLGNTNGYLNSFSFEGQAKFFEETINLTRSKKMSGFFINSMFDYVGDFSSMYSKYSPVNNYSIGIIGNDKNINRISYNVIKSKLVTNKRVTIPLGKKNDDAPMFFILVGLFLSVMMGVLINSKKKFREDATRALLRPYNFFADIRDHRIISGFSTIILMVILAGAHALLLNNLLFYFRNSIILEKFLLSFGMPSLLSTINYFAWNPYEAFLFFTIISLLLFLIISIVVALASFFIKMKIYFRNIFFTIVWAVLPLSILLPLKMVLYRVLTADVINLYIYIFLLLYFFWIIQRIIKGVYVIFDISIGQAYFYTLLIFITVVGGTLFLFQLNYSTIDFIINTIKQAQLM